MPSLPELKITVFSDYICPFCYLGHHRLMRLNDSYIFKINWCFLEIHPETSAAGEPIDSLDYPNEQWQLMLDNLSRIASEENIPLAKLSFITNSKDALLLAEATKQCGRKIFYNLHEKLFRAYFVEGINIGDRDQLRKIALACKVPEKIISSSWTNAADAGSNLDSTSASASDYNFQQRLIDNFNIARKYNITSVPSFVFGEKILNGVVAESAFREAAELLILKN